MRNSRDTVQGFTCPPARPTRAAALILASILSMPVFVVLSLVDWLLL
ncbi:hypothetical protein AB9K34_23310 [Sedimentitalea sp. XS_ASV28]